MNRKLQLIVFLFLVLLNFDDSFGQLPINYTVKTNNFKFRDCGRAQFVIIGWAPNTVGGIGGFRADSAAFRTKQLSKIIAL